MTSLLAGPSVRRSRTVHGENAPPLRCCERPNRFRQVAVERVKEFSELPREPPEFVEPRPPASWPTTGAIKCEDLVIRYAVRPPALSPLPSGMDPDEHRVLLGSRNCQTSCTICRLRFGLVRKSVFWVERDRGRAPSRCRSSASWNRWRGASSLTAWMSRRLA